MVKLAASGNAEHAVLLDKLQSECAGRQFGTARDASNKLCCYFFGHSTELMHCPLTTSFSAIADGLRHLAPVPIDYVILGFVFVKRLISDIAKVARACGNIVCCN
jgi:hypothetical protein